MIKGQYIRIFSNMNETAGRVVAASTNMVLHISATVENSSTKDTTGDWVENQVTGLQYDISVDALVVDSDSGASVLNDALNKVGDAESVAFEIAPASGDKQRTKGSTICSGTALVTSLQITAPNRQNSTYNMQLTGKGELVVPA